MGSATSCSAKLLATLPALAVRVTACAVVTDDTVAVNPALVALAEPLRGRQRNRRIATRQSHTQTAAPGAVVSVTVHASLPVPVIDALLQTAHSVLPVPPYLYRQADHRRTVGRRVALDRQLTGRRSCAVSDRTAHSAVTDCVGFKVTGKVAPDIVKPVPLNVAELMVTGAVPVEVNVTGSVEAVFTVTLPNVRLAALTVNVGSAAFSCSAKLLETLPALAVRVTACAVVIDDTVAVNPALVALAGTTTRGRHRNRRIAARQGHTQTAAPGRRGQRHRACIASRPVIDALLQDSALSAAVRRARPRQIDNRRAVGRRVALDSQLTRRRSCSRGVELHIQGH